MSPDQDRIRFGGDLNVLGIDARDAGFDSELGVSLRQLGLRHSEEVPLRLESVIEFLAGLAASPLEQLKGLLPDSLEGVSHLLG